VQGYKDALPQGSLDGITDRISHAAFGGGLTFTAIIAADVLQNVWWDHRDHIGEPLAKLQQFAKEWSESPVILAEYEDALAGEEVMEKLMTLMTYIQCNPVQVERYKILRGIHPQHRVSALSGLHRDIWRGIDLSFADKVRVCDMFEHCPDDSGSIEAREEYAQSFITPPADSEFLRKSNPMMPGKLLLAALVLREEVRLIAASDDLELHSMCHLYNALRQLGYLDHSWQALDDFIDLHMPEIFGLERPKADARFMLSRALMSFGVHPELIRRHRNRDQGRRSVDFHNSRRKRRDRQGGLLLSPFTLIVAGHIHSVNSLRGVVDKMDKYMVAQAARDPTGAGKSNKRKGKVMKSFTEELGPVAFLEEMEKHMRELDRHFAIDTTELSHAARALFKQMDTDVLQSVYNEMDVKKDEQSGNQCMLITLMQLKAESEGDRHAAKSAKALASTAARVLREYILAGASGVPHSNPIQTVSLSALIEDSELEGLVEPTASSSQAPARQGRLKGKARKEAKMAKTLLEAPPQQ